jgi:MFS transporter, DHA2 family, multidrug resistance protein
MNKKWILLAIVSTGLLLISLDMTILYSALPTLTHDLAASASEKLWIVNAYPLVMAGLLLGIGALGDRLGHRKIFMTGMIVFGIASLLAAFSPTPGILIISRIILAVGAAMMMPATLSLIRITFTDSKERALAIGVWGAVFSGGAGLGPIVGGILLEFFYWGSVFLINVPITLIAFALSIKLVPKTTGSASRKWDWLSSLQIMIGLVGIIYGVKELTSHNAKPLVAITSFLIGVTAIVIFSRRQKKISSPLFDFSLLRNISFSSGVITAGVSSFILIGTQLIFTQRYQLVVGYSPLDTALFMVAIPVGSFLAGVILGMHLHKFNIINTQLFSLIVAILGLIGFLFTHELHPILQWATLGLLGIGLGCAGTSASNAIMNNAPVHKAGMAASTEEVSYELGGAFGVAILGSLSSFFYTMSLNIPADLNVPASVKDSLDEALLFSETLPTSVANELIGLSKAAFDQSFIIVTVISIIILALSCIFIVVANKKSKEQTHEKSSAH